MREPLFHLWGAHPQSVKHQIERSQTVKDLSWGRRLVGMCNVTTDRASLFSDDLEEKTNRCGGWWSLGVSHKLAWLPVYYSTNMFFVKPPVFC
jgi:hypothetical protein